MNFDRLEEIWDQQIVAGTMAPPTEIAAKLKRDLRSARRRFRGMIVMAIGLFIIEWTMAIAVHVTGIKRFTALEFGVHLAGSGFYLLWLVLAVRSARAVGSEALNMGRTLREGAAASLRVIELQLRNYRIAAVALPLAVGVSALFSFLKFREGALPGLGAMVSVAILSLLAMIIALAMGRRFRKELAPGRRDLNAMLAAMESDG